MRWRNSGVTMSLNKCRHRKLCAWQELAAKALYDSIMRILKEQGMKKYKTRIVYTLIRVDADKSTLREAKESFLGVLDEVGEWLYGGVGDEKIEARLEIYDDDNKRWMEVKCG
jgi:hypothetical protein